MANFGTWVCRGGYHLHEENKNVNEAKWRLHLQPNWLYWNTTLLFGSRVENNKAVFIVTDTENIENLSFTHDLPKIAKREKVKKISFRKRKVFIHDMHHCNVFWRPSSWLVVSDVKSVNTSFATNRLLGPWCNAKWCISWIEEDG